MEKIFDYITLNFIPNKFNSLVQNFTPISFSFELQEMLCAHIQGIDLKQFHFNSFFFFKKLSRNKIIEKILFKRMH